MLVNLSCASNRHRSVGFGFTMYHILKTQGYSIELLHWNSSHWSEMACGGRYPCCQNAAASLRVIRHLLTIPAAKSRPISPTDAPSTATTFSSSSRRTIAIPSRRTTPTITVDDDPVGTSRGRGHDDPVGTSRDRADVRDVRDIRDGESGETQSRMERQLDRILNVLERQEDRRRDDDRRHNDDRREAYRRRSRSPLRRRRVEPAHTRPAEPSQPPRETCPSSPS